MKYRPEIDGLRAIAVVPVILFHAGFEFFSGGFVGVDIFFVISGYLITTILISELYNDKLSIVNFYIRRARRILPVLLMVLLATYAYSWFHSLPAFHKVVGQYVTSTLLFMSNILFFIKGSDYFGLGAESNPLLHTWSLSVEEQYYLFFPFLVMLGGKFRIKSFTPLLFVLLVASLALALNVVIEDPVAAFFMPQYRVWEIILGAITATVLLEGCSFSRPVREVGGAIGLALILYAILSFNDRTPTPSLYTLIPTVGTVLIIAFAVKETLVAKVLSNPLFVGIGLISYSLYLWHQPVLVFGHSYFQGHNLEWAKTPILLSAIVTLSLISWTTVEKYFRSNAYISNTKFAAISVSGVTALVLIGVLGHVNGGFPNRDPLFKRLAQNPGYGLQCNGNNDLIESCSSSETPTIAALGNSYMMHFVRAIDEANPSRGVLQLTTDACGLGILGSPTTAHCSDFFNGALDTINSVESIKTVYISSPFNELLSAEGLDNFHALLARLADMNVIILGSTPHASFHVGECIVKNFDGESITPNTNCTFKVPESHALKTKLLQNIAKVYENISYIDLTDSICTGAECNPIINNGILLYLDGGHLTTEGARYILAKVKY